MATIYKTIYVESDALGNCVKVVELKTLPANRVEELKKQASEYRTQQLSEEQRQQELALTEQQEKEQKELVRSIFIAKHQFDTLVDKGVCETTEEFEEHFEQFALGGIEFNIELAPSGFLTILERVR